MKKAKKIPPKRGRGRPTKYTPEVLDKMAADLIRWFKKPGSLWLKDFALARGFHWSQFTDLAERSPEFSKALKVAKDMQESKLFRMGLSKKHSTSMAIFALKNVSGWRDKSEITGADGKPLLESIKVTIVNGP